MKKKKRAKRITLDSRPVFRKRRLLHNRKVSMRNDDFSCEGEADVIGGNNPNPWDDDLDLLFDLSRTYGVSKQEHLVSDHYTINGMRSIVGSAD